MTRAFVRHIRSADLCTRGARAWFAARGWSWTDFLRDGVDVVTLRATGDGLALRVARQAEMEAAGEQRQ